MVDDAEADVYEAQLIKKAMSQFNYAFPSILMDSNAKVIRGLREMGLDRRRDTTAYAECMLWTMRSYFESNPIDEWKLIGRRDCVHLQHQDDGLIVRVTKEFAFTGGLSPAGKNGARRKAYMQGRLRTESEMMQLFGNPSLAEHVVHIAWSEENGEFNATAYVPKDPGHFPKSPDAWLSFGLGLPQSDYDNLSFSTDDEAPLFVPTKNTIKEPTINVGDKVAVQE